VKRILSAMLISAGVLMTLPTTVSAALTGSDILPACRNFVHQRFTIDPLDQGICIGTIEALAFAAPDQRFTTTRSCPPDGITIAELTRTVVAWGEQHPDKRNSYFFNIVLWALHDLWPCRE
jgi:hypothetical protein